MDPSFRDANFEADTRFSAQPRRVGALSKNTHITGFKRLLNEKGRTDASNRGRFFTLVENLGKGDTGRLTCETSELRNVFKSQSHTCNQLLSSLLSLKPSTAQHRSWERFGFPRYHLICYPHTNKAASSQAFTPVASIPTKENFFFPFLY